MSDAVLLRRPVVPEGKASGAAALLHGTDWSRSSLGAPETWPQSLKTTVGLLLPAQAQIVLFWGPQFIALYNDAYAPTIGDKHPRAFGQPAAQHWAELWDDLEPLLRQVRDTGKTVFAKDRPFYIERHGYGETVYFDISYSAVPDEHGEVGGVLCIVSETTERVLGERRVRASESRLRGILDGMGEALAVLDHDFRIIDMNAEALRMENRPRDEVIGKTHWEAHPDADPALGEVLRKVMAERTPAVLRHRYVRTDGRETWLDTRSFPIEEGIAVFYHDVTDRVRSNVALAQSEKIARGRANELAAIYDAAPIGLCVLDADLRFIRVNERLAEINGHSAAEHIGRSIHDIVPKLSDQASDTIRRVLAGESVWGVEITGETAAEPGRVRTWSENWVPLRDENGIVQRITVSAEEITREKRAQQQQRLLIDELNHRVKNLLAIVQGIAAQTFKDADKDARLEMEGRLAALAAAHNLLTRRNWEEAPLRHVVQAALEPYAAEQNDRFDIDGPDLMLAPKLAVSMALAVHELATNAAKYGALSVPGGRVRLHWRAENGNLYLSWEESGGPPVAEPQRRGFGSRLLERGLAAELDGTVRMVFRPEGLVCTVQAPLPELSD